jgi:hypothetical protein
MITPTEKIAPETPGKQVKFPKNDSAHDLPISPDSFKESLALSNSHTHLPDLEDKGFQLPDKLKKFWEGFLRVIEYIDTKIVPNIMKGAGYFFKYLGLIMLVVGTVHCIIVICTTPLNMGLMPVLLALITSGALPVVVGGASLYSLGKDFTDHKFGGLYYILMALPFTNYFGKFFPDVPNPNLG